MNIPSDSDQSKRKGGKRNKKNKKWITNNNQQNNGNTKYKGAQLPPEFLVKEPDNRSNNRSNQTRNRKNRNRNNKVSRVISLLLSKLGLIQPKFSDQNYFSCFQAQNKVVVEKKPEIKEDGKKPELQQILAMFGDVIDKEIIEDYWTNLNGDYLQAITILSEMVDQVETQKKQEEEKKRNEEELK